MPLTSVKAARMEGERARGLSESYPRARWDEMRRRCLGAMLCAAEPSCAVSSAAAAGALTFLTDVGLRKGSALSTYLTCFAVLALFLNSPSERRRTSGFISG